MRRLFLFTTLLLAGIGALVWAQQPDYPQEDAGDAPDHGVARLSLINGNVSVAQSDSGELEGAAVNAPVVAGDRVLTGDGSRAEVQFDGANLVRLAPSTEVRMGDLQYRRYQVQIAQGLVTLRVLRDSDAQMEISTPSISMRPLRQGTYRVMVRPDGTSEITVRAGEAEAFSPGGSEPLRAGQMLMARGSAYDPEIQTATAFPNDDWDRWNAERDRYFERDMSRYVSPDIYGTEELGNYGRWTNDPQYGSVWVPTVDADWAPYRDGRWSYVDYYGWSWISYDPWGWAPYHYGRWYRGSSGWAWYPGPIGPRYYWRPALVGFFGWGSPGFGAGFASFGFGNVGWVPLAPHEPFRPWYGRGRSFGVVANTNVVNVYRNARFTNAVTSVRSGEFGRTAIRRDNFVRASAVDLSRGSAINGQMPFAPARQSRQFGSGSQVNTQGMPRVNSDTRANTRFFSSPSNSQARTPVPGTSQNGPGWRRFDQAQAPAQNFNSAPRQGFAPSYTPREQQPVRISPPIVNNRNEGPGATRGNSFGGTRPNYGGGGATIAPGAPQAPAQGNGNFSTPREPQFNRPAEPRNFNRPSEPPRGQQGGGNFNAPRAPQGGGGYNAPAPRGPQGGGGGGGAPRGGGGGNNGGGNGGGGGGGNLSNGGGHGEGHGGGRR